MGIELKMTAFFLRKATVSVCGESKWIQYIFCTGSLRKAATWQSFEQLGCSRESRVSSIAVLMSILPILILYTRFQQIIEAFRLYFECRLLFFV